MPLMVFPGLGGWKTARRKSALSGKWHSAASDGMLGTQWFCRDKAALVIL